jgi:hypothetical protein
VCGALAEDDGHVGFDPLRPAPISNARMSWLTLSAGGVLATGVSARIDSMMGEGSCSLSV